jgi:hypothetical protein
MQKLEQECVFLMRQLAGVNLQAQVLVEKMDAAKKRLQEAQELVKKLGG